MQCLDNRKTGSGKTPPPPRTTKSNKTLAIQDTSGGGVPSALLSKFSADHQLRMRRDSDDRWCVGGVAGSIHDAHEDGKTLLVSIHTDTSKARWWLHSVVMKVPLIAAASVGAAVTGCFPIDLSNVDLVAAALRAVCANRHRSTQPRK
jgi:hypothetical protein